MKIREFYEAAQHVLRHELLTFDGQDTKHIADSFAEIIAKRRYTCYACAIMPDHIHLLIRKHRDTAEEMIEHLQNSSRDALIQAGKRPSDHPVWGGGPGWKVFQNSQRQIQATIEYIRQNPVKIGRPIQEWDFVKTYDGWMPGRPPRGT